MLILSLENDFKDHVEGIKENELPTDLQTIINHGHKGCKMDVESADNVFDIQVETVLNQAPQVNQFINWQFENTVVEPFPNYNTFHSTD